MLLLGRSAAAQVPLGIKTRDWSWLAGLENVNHFRITPIFPRPFILESVGDGVNALLLPWFFIQHENKKGFSILNLEGLTFLPHGI